MSSADLFTINEIPAQEFISDPRYHDSPYGWYWRAPQGSQHLVFLDPDCPSEPYVLIKGKVVDIPLDATLTDW